MKNLLYVLALLFSFQLLAQKAVEKVPESLPEKEENTYIMYQSIELTPIQGHGQDLRKGLQAHNEKYHKEGSQAVNVWSVNSGPRMGSLLWVKGPLTWTDMDRDIEADGHMDDWRANVAPHAKMGQMEFWRLMDDKSYVPDGFVPKVMVVRYFDIKSQKWDNASDNWDSVFKVYNEKKYDMGLQIYTNSANSGDGRDWAVIWYFDSWASMDKDRNFWDSYDEMHDVERREYFERWNELADFKGMEIFTLVPELSVADTAD